MRLTAKLIIIINWTQTTCYLVRFNTILNLFYSYASGATAMYDKSLYIIQVILQICRGDYFLTRQTVLRLPRTEALRQLNESINPEGESAYLHF